MTVISGETRSQAPVYGVEQKCKTCRGSGQRKIVKDGKISYIKCTTCKGSGKFHG